MAIQSAEDESRSTWRQFLDAVGALPERIGDTVGIVIDFFILERNLAVRNLRLQSADNPFGALSASLRYFFVVNAHIWAFWGMGRANPGGTSWFIFFTAGFSTYILFGVGRTSIPSKALNPSSMSLNIKWIHLFIAALIAESIKIIVAFIIQMIYYAIFPVKYMGHMVVFPDLPLLAACWMVSMATGIGIGLIVYTAIRIWPMLESVTETFFWALFMTSGVYMPLSNYPPTVVPLFEYSPLLTAIEYSRHALDPAYPINDGLSLVRAAAIAFSTLLFGLAFRRIASRRHLSWIPR
ncbi:MAG: hypothetical protein P4M15_10255 [Alphaproteobacteria bacterium]|nr:hypothetical protein [Alphaproteobacteria bacterium]